MKLIFDKNNDWPSFFNPLILSKFEFEKEVTSSPFSSVFRISMSPSKLKQRKGLFYLTKQKKLLQTNKVNIIRKKLFSLSLTIISSVFAGLKVP